MLDTADLKKRNINEKLKKKKRINFLLVTSHNRNLKKIHSLSASQILYLVIETE